MRYFIPMTMGHLTAVLPAGSVIWAFQNGGTTARLQIRRLAIFTGFDGTGNPSSSVYAMYRFSGADFTGGSVLVPVKANSKLPASVVAGVRQSASAALEQTGVIIEPAPLFATQNPRDNGAVLSQLHTWEKEDECVVLNPGEGLCIKLEVPSVVGDIISGTCNYDENRSPLF